MSHSYISYWEHETWLKDIDISILGSGIVGLSSAYFLKKKYPKKNIVVFERGFLPHGATTRNAGFSCFGSATEILSDIKKNGKEKAYELVKDRFSGLNSLIQLHGPDNIGYENLGGYEIFTNEDANVFEETKTKLDELNKDLQDVLQIKSKVYQVSDKSRSSELGLSNVVGMFFNPWEGQIQSGLLIKSLTKLCRDAGVEIFTGIEITKFENHSSGVSLMTNNSVEIKTKELLITTNGFAKQFVPDLDVQPARGQVLVTSPIEGLKLLGAFHHHEGFDYFRNVGNRVLLGGGRNLDIDKEITPQMERNDKIYEYLMRFLSETVIPGKKFEIEFEWSGIMGVGEDKSPIIQHIQPNVMVAIRMGGMGVAIGTEVGKKVSLLL